MKNESLSSLFSARSEPAVVGTAAVVGYGSIGRRHCDNLARLGVKRRVVVRRRDSANPAFIPPDELLVVHSVAESIAAGAKLAIVCNPTSLHLATAEEYMAAGIPVLIEKPLSAELAHAERFVECAERSGICAGMAYPLRYHPAYRLAHDYIAHGRLGVIENAQAWFESFLPDWHPWEDYRHSYAARPELGGGVLPTLDHEIDFMLWCYGMPLAASGHSWRSGALDMQSDDNAHITMKYAGHMAEIRLSMSQRERRRGFELIGSEATLSFSWEQAELRLVNRGGAAHQTLWDEAEFDLNGIYLAMLQDALRAAEAKSAMPVSLRAGLDALRVADAVKSGSFS